MIQEDVDEFDKKFKRKMSPAYPDGKEKIKEQSYDFCQRIINEAIKEKLKRGDKDEKRK